MFFFFGYCIALSAEMHIVVDLRNPVYQDGILRTNEGGVVQGQDLRIQAETIEYAQKGDLHYVRAQENLMVQYKGRIFVGDELYYNFQDNTGVVYNGKTFSSPWYIKGEKITLQSDGCYEVKGASITAAENKESIWDVHAAKVCAVKSDLFTAKNISVRLFQVPAFWIPSLKVNLKHFEHDPMLRYTVNLDKSQGLRAAARYQLYSWRDFTLFGRIEYRWSTGWGGALETEYFPPDFPASFVTRSYVGTNRLETAPDKKFRFRLEGAYHWHSINQKTHASLTWDKYSDVRMPSDFQSEDFEVGTAKQTLLWLDHREPFALFNCKIRPRVNAFESLKQELPNLYAHILPFSLPFGILSYAHCKAAYLDFAYSDQLCPQPPFHKPADFRSGRLEISEKLSKPFPMGPMTFTPYLGAIGILYTNHTDQYKKPLGLITYGADLYARAARTYTTCTHIVEPYVGFYALSKPTFSPDEHYIFSIQDGYHQIQQIQGGIKTALFAPTEPKPFFTAHVYANGFCAQHTTLQFIPRLYCMASCHLPSLDFYSQNGWNFRHQTLDFSNQRLRWTINTNIAFTFEMRYRSPFDWRKADHENFILDVTRTEQDLLSSPLSDRRITLLANIFFRPSPFWECQIESHHGFYRLHEKPYNEIKIDIFTWIYSSLKLRLSYSHTDKDDRIMGGISLIRK